MDPTRANAHANIAEILMRQEKFNEAAEHLQEALAHRPDSPGIHRMLGEAYAKSGQQDQADHHLRRADELEAAIAAPELPVL